MMPLQYKELACSFSLSPCMFVIQNKEISSDFIHLMPNWVGLLKGFAYYSSMLIFGLLGDKDFTTHLVGIQTHMQLLLPQVGIKQVL